MIAYRNCIEVGLNWDILITLPSKDNNSRVAMFREVEAAGWTAVYDLIVTLIQNVNSAHCVVDSGNGGLR